MNQAVRLYTQDVASLRLAAKDIRLEFPSDWETPNFTVHRINVKDALPGLATWKETPLKEMVKYTKDRVGIWKSINDKTLGDLKDVSFGLDFLGKALKWAKKIGMILAICLPIVSLIASIIYITIQCKTRKKLSRIPEYLLKRKDNPKPRPEPPAENDYSSLPDVPTTPLGSESITNSRAAMLASRIEMQPVQQPGCCPLPIAACCPIFTRKRKEYKLADPTTLFNLKEAYYNGIINSTDETNRKILTDSLDDDDERRMRRLNEAGTTWTEISKLAGTTVSHLKECPMGELEAAIQLWKQMRRDNYRLSDTAFQKAINHNWKPSWEQSPPNNLYPHIEETGIPLQTISNSPPTAPAPETPQNNFSSP